MKQAKSGIFKVRLESRFVELIDFILRKYWAGQKGIGIHFVVRKGEELGSKNNCGQA